MAAPSPRDELIRQYYAAFNERRFADAAALFTDDAVIDQMPFQRRERGGAAYLLFAKTWTTAFPDAEVIVQRIKEGPHDTYEVDLFGEGTHRGELALGGCHFRPTGVKATLHLREVLEFRGERIASACLSFDFQELASQLARIDEAALLAQLQRIRALEEQLRRASPDDDRRGLMERIGRELDAARQTVRPYFVR